MSNKTNLPPNPTRDFVQFEEYVEQRSQFFPRPTSASYFMRWQRRILLETGALISTPAGDWVLADVLDDYILCLSRAGTSFQSDALQEVLRAAIESKKDLCIDSTQEMQL